MTRNRIWGESKHTEEFVVINKPTRLNEIIGRLENLTAHACAACLTLGGTASLYAGYSNYENNFQQKQIESQPNHFEPKRIEDQKDKKKIIDDDSELDEVMDIF